MSKSWMLATTALVLAAILGSAYALGRVLGIATVSKSPAAAQASIPAPSPSTAPPPPSTTAPAPPTAARSATPVPPAAGATRSPDPDLPPDSARLGPERGGPFGARITTGGEAVALTFDDGPDPRYTPQVLDLLRAYRVKATFCLVGNNARAYPELVRAIAADGHTLCNHSWAHDLALGSRSTDTILRDLIRTNEAIRAAAPGVPIPYFRQPGGNWTSSVVAVAERLGMTSLHWAVDPRDWDLPGAGRIAATVTGQALPGAIVLLHDAGGDRQGTVNALRWILSDLTDRLELAALPTGDRPTTRDDPSASARPSTGDRPPTGAESSAGDGPPARDDPSAQPAGGRSG